MFDRQELTAEDVERINSSRTKLDEQMGAVLARKAEAEQRAWKIEATLRNAHASLDAVVETYNAAMADLSVQPNLARALAQAPLQLRVDSGTPEQPLSADPRVAVQPVLCGLQDRTASEAQHMASERLQLQDAAAKLAESAAEKQDECEAQQRKVALLDQQYAQAKEVRCLCRVLLMALI